MAPSALFRLPWPVGNLFELSSLPPQRQPRPSNAGKESNKPTTNADAADSDGAAPRETEKLDAAKGHWASELAIRYTRLVPYLIVSLLSYRYTFPLERAGGDDWSWVLVVVARNTILLNMM